MGDKSKTEDHKHADPAMLVMLIAIVFSIILMILPAPAGLSPAGQKVLGIAIIAIGLWGTEVLPIGVTGMLVVLSLMVSGCAKLSRSFDRFCQTGGLFSNRCFNHWFGGSKERPGRADRTVFPAAIPCTSVGAFYTPACGIAPVNPVTPVCNNPFGNSCPCLWTGADTE